MRVVLQQQKRLFREGLALLLSRAGGIEVLGAVATIADLVERCRIERPDVAILELDALELDTTESVCSELMTPADGLTMLALYDAASPAHQRAAVRAGVSALVERRAGFAAVLDALIATPPVSDAAETERGPRTGPSRRRARLTGREADILTYVGRGWTSRSISEHLGISPKTVENHKQRIFVKLGVQNQAHAVALALGNGFILPIGNLHVTR